MTNASISDISSTLSFSLTPLHQVLICGTLVLPQLHYFWNTFQTELAAKSPYKASIGGIRLKLQELQREDAQAQKIRAEKYEGWEDSGGVLHHQCLPYVPKLIKTKLISRQHNDPLVGHFGIEKTWELVARKYYWLTLRHNIETYIKGCDVCLTSKAVRHKLYGKLQLLPISSHRWKDLSIDFVTGLPILAD